MCVAMNQNQRMRGLPLRSNGRFWPDNFLWHENPRLCIKKESPLGLYEIISHGSGERGAGTTDDRSGIVCALEHKFRGICIWRPLEYEATSLSANTLSGAALRRHHGFSLAGT